jgi:altronate hydrolase
MTPVSSKDSRVVNALRISSADNVMIALEDVPAGAMLGISGVVAREPIGRGHKAAYQAIGAGEPVLRYGFPIGLAKTAIATGAHVHTHNVVTALAGEVAYEGTFPDSAETPAIVSRLYFQGYRRPDGRVATRNEIWILPTVGCVARTAQGIADASSARHAGRVDAIRAFAHPFGCSQLGSDLDATRRMLAALAAHPNAGGVLIVGLGCESNQLDALVEDIPVSMRDGVRTLVSQVSIDEIAEGVALVDALVDRIADCERSDCDLSTLALGVKCGGSDGFSGLTANPLVGRMSDAVTAAGGSAILTEIPEIFGAEHVLMARAANRDVSDRIGALVNDFKRYFLDHGEPVSENPSPGNIAGGITTLEEKSLGAVQKAGHAIVTDVLRYGERIRRPGLSLLEAPGNDAVSSTALTAAGATMILFTTGRGTPLGFPAPTLKIASNHDLAARKPGWIDFDAGAVIEDGLDVVSERLLDRIIAIASGEPTAAERNGEHEIALWKRGVTL